MKRRLAIALLYVAAKLLPASRLEWLRDMRAELDHVQSDGAALEWAFGCVLASLKERVNEMLDSNGKISRPVLVLEWLTCFVPLTMVWFVGLRFMGIYGATPDIMIATAFGALGPVALVVALYATLSQSQRTFVVPLKILAGAFALLLVLQLIDAGAKDRLDLEWFKFEWANVVMFAILPLAGVVHLWSMSRATR